MGKDLMEQVRNQVQVLSLKLEMKHRDPADCCPTHCSFLADIQGQLDELIRLTRERRQAIRGESGEHKILDPEDGPRE